MSGITLGQVSKRQRILEVACSKCDRKGKYRVSNLIAQHGASMALPSLASLLCSDCRNKDTFANDRCSVYFPNLVHSV